MSKTSLGARYWGSLWCLRLLLLMGAPTACIDTELDTSTSAACPSLGEAFGKVVFISAYVGSLGLVRCSGVLLTRTLIVTALGCTMVPNSLADRYGRAEPPDGVLSGDVYYSGDVDGADCKDGVSVEDGTFATLFGPALPSEAFEVYLPSERITADGHTVSEVSRVGTTRCAPGVALLKLASGLGPGRIAIRAEEGDATEQPLVLSYLSVTNAATLERQDISLPSGTGSEPSATNSFDIADTCPEQSGGALFSATSGALVGILGSSRGTDDCQRRDSGTAVRLSAFRRSLIAAAEPEALELESGPTTSNLSVCAAR
jgi:hypothetical protein